MDPQRSEHLPTIVMVCFASFMATLDAYIVNVSLPAIAQGFRASMSDVSRVILCYMLSLSSTTLVFGKLSDRLGARRLLLLGFAVFGGASLLCGIAPTLLSLIGARFVQGFGAAMIIISGYAALSKFLPETLRGWAFGLVSTSAALGVAVGAPLGGVVTGYLSWHWIFLINIPIGGMAILAGRRFLPDDSREATAREREPFDYPGALFSFLAILGLVYALNNGTEHGWGSPPILTAFGIALVFLFLFLRRETRCPAPLLKLSLFAIRRLDVALIAFMAATMVIAGNNFLMPFFLEYGKGLPPQQTGFVLMIYSVALMLVGPLAGRLSDRLPPTVLCTLGMASASGACLFFALDLQTPGLGSALVFLAWQGASLALFLSPNANHVMRLAPAGEQGSTSGVFNLFSRLGMILGVCLFESIFTTLFPGDIHLLAKGATLPPSLLGAFRWCWLAAVGLCLLVAVLSAVSITRRPAPGAAEPGPVLLDG
ncbi:MAG: MFS transporter [Acidobacteria bacterium]|nr:MFS transporter [Acidobacteriota bacterium]